MLRWRETEEIHLSDPAGSGAFELSRIRAEGWQAARKLLASSAGDIDPAEADALNPHGTPETRARWTQGFLEALGIGGFPSRRRGNPRRTATSPTSDGGKTQTG